MSILKPKDGDYEKRAMASAVASILDHLNLAAEQKPKQRVTEAQHKKKVAQAKDIPDQAFVDLIQGLQSIPKVWSSYPGLEWYNNKARWVTFNELCAVWADIPPKVIRAKAKRLILKGVIEGCWCGCRGDFHIPEKPYLDLLKEKYGPIPTA